MWRIPDWLTSLEHATDVMDEGVPPESTKGARVFTAQMPQEVDTLGSSLGHGTLAPADATADGIAVNVWVDGRGRIVHISESWDAMSSAGEPMIERIDVDLDRFGTAVVPRPPQGPLSTLTPGQMFVTAGIP